MKATALFRAVLGLGAAALLAVGCNGSKSGRAQDERPDDVPPYKAPGSPPDCMGNLKFTTPREAFGSSFCQKQGGSVYRLVPDRDVLADLECHYSFDFTGSGRARGRVACGGRPERSFVLHDYNSGEMELPDGSTLRFRIEYLN